MSQKDVGNISYYNKTFMGVPSSSKAQQHVDGKGIGAVIINEIPYYVVSKDNANVCLIKVNNDKSNETYYKKVKNEIQKIISDRTLSISTGGGKTLKRKNQRHKRRNKTAKQI